MEDFEMLETERQAENTKLTPEGMTSSKASFAKDVRLPAFQLTLVFFDALLFVLFAGGAIQLFDRGVDVTVPMIMLMCSNFLVIYVMELYKFETVSQIVRMPGRIFLAAILFFSFISIVTFSIEALRASVFPVRYPLFVGYLGFLSYLFLSRILLGRWYRTRMCNVKWLVVCKPEIAEAIYFDARSRASQLNFHFLIPEKCTTNFPVLDSWNNLDSWIGYPWAGIILDLSDLRSEQMLPIILSARLRNAKIYDVADFYEKIWMKIPVFSIKHKWFIFARGFHLLGNTIALRLKRVTDKLIAFCVLLPTAPIMLLAMLLVRLETPGGALYKQVRTGEGGKPFTIYKIRTMVHNAESNGVQWTKESDSRITKLGSILRKTRIDELPQLWNVLTGDMSFIGPRPERPEFVESLERQIPYFGFRHLVKPGITGWAQVMYPYGNSVQDAREKLQYDLFYLKNHSLMFDMGILVKTLQVVFWGKGM